MRTEKPRKPGGAGARVLACSQPMVSQGTHAARQPEVGAAPAAGRRRARAPRAASRAVAPKFTYILSLTSGKARTTSVHLKM